MTGKLLDNRYQLLKKIGSGGMADVYMAKDILLDRIVAVKILHSNFAEDNEFIVRFRHEAQSAGKLSHPNIVGIYDVGCDQGVYYIIMEYVEGETLKQYIQTHPNIPIDTAVRIAIEIGSALEEAHENGIIHCDIKPHNILLTDSGKVKVTDFGIARAINSSTIMNRESILGSVHYLSPEQASGDKVTAKTDIYSLGIVLYEMLTHHLPFDGDTAVGIALKHIQNDIPRPTKYNPAISPMLEECLLTALQRDPDKRYDSVADFISELKIAQGFTTSIYRPAHHDFTVMTKPTVPHAPKAMPMKKQETKLIYFLTHLPQKYIWISMVILFLMAFAWAFFSFGNFWSSKNIVVPNVVGKPLAEAELLLKKENLRVSVDEIASDTVPVGQIISQTPQAGANVKEQRIIHLTVSKGGSVLLVPDLKGMTLDDARKQLEKLGLKVGAVEKGSNEVLPYGAVISQTPLAGSSAEKGTIVNLVINDRQEKVPSVVGMTLSDAQKALAAVHMSVGQVTAADSGIKLDDPNNLVISQSPSAGMAVSGSSNTVNLTVGKGQNSASSEKRGTVNITIPREGKVRHVEIVVVDDSGKHTVYSSQAEPGSTIVKDVSGTGTVRVQVLVDNSVVQDREL